MVHKYWYVGHVSIEPLKKNINYQFFLSDYGNRRTHAAWGRHPNGAEFPGSGTGIECQAKVRQSQPLLA